MKIRKITDLYFYSSLHISLGCCALYAFHSVRCSTHMDGDYLGLLFCATLFVYSLHRYIGIQKVNAFQEKGRFLIIEEYKDHILVYAIIAAIGLIYFSLQQQFKTLLLLSSGGIVSILYTLPVFVKKKRLRDFGYVKIFLIAIVWSLSVIIVPSIINKLPSELIVIMGLECFFFFLAITLPFDIRDLSVDKAINVNTIPSKIGPAKASKLAITFIVLAIALNLTHWYYSNISFHSNFGLLVTYGISLGIIPFVQTKKDDYYFTGLLDGLMLLPLVVNGIMTYIIT